jgi:hypothetical protein
MAIIAQSPGSSGQSSRLCFALPAMRMVAALACVGIARLTSAAPPDFTQVPNETVWIVHADVDALRNATLYQRLKATTAWKPLADQIGKVNAQLGMDLTRDLHEMTIFGPKLSEHKTTLVMRADWDAQTFRQKLAAARDRASSVSGRYEIHRFARKDRGQVRTVAGACWRPGTFVFAQSPDDVQHSLGVLDGRQPHLAGHTSPLASDVPAGTVLLARMIAVGDFPPAESPILKQTDQIALACGENAGECFLHGELLAKDAASAGQIKKMLDGCVAMARLHAPAELGKLLSHVKLGVAGRVVQLEYRIAAAELAVQLENALRKPDQTK